MTGKKSEKLIVNRSTRICKNCGEEKTLNKEHFYFKNDRGDYDKTCVVCRRSARLNRYKNKNTVKIELFPVPQESFQEVISVSSKESGENITNQNDLDTLFKFFEILREWRNEFKLEKPNEFNKKWEA